MIRQYLAFTSWFLLILKLSAQQLTVDQNFNPSDIGTWGGCEGFNYWIYSQSVAQDGKIILGGEFTSIDGIKRNNIARLNSDGSVDEAFDPLEGFNIRILSTTVQSDGKIIAAGYPKNFNENPINHIARLNSDGAHDHSFNADIVQKEISNVKKVILQSDGKIIAGGYFDYLTTKLRHNLARLNQNGSVDQGFSPDIDPKLHINDIAIQPDGRILAGGSHFGTGISLMRFLADGSPDHSFTNTANFHGTVLTIAIQHNGKILIGGCFSKNGYNNLIRLNSDGTIDTNFPAHNKLSNGGVNDIIIQPDERILIGGAFNDNNETKGLFRLNHDGSIDHTFNINEGFNSYVHNIALTSAGKLLIAGDFNRFNDINKSFYIGLNNDGTYNTKFRACTGFNKQVYTLAIQSDNKILTGGDFTSFNGVKRNTITRLNEDGFIDTTFNANSIFSKISGFRIMHAIAIQQDEKILCGGNFEGFPSYPLHNLLRLNIDGSIDSTFISGTGFDKSVRAIVIQNDGKILAGGDFRYYNGTTIGGIARLLPNGELDPSFNPPANTYSSIETIEVDNDGKILIGGGIIFYNGGSHEVKRFLRLNPDGSIDESFNIGSGFDFFVYKIVALPNGNILVGGNFNSYQGLSVQKLACINPDGSLNASFKPDQGIDGAVRAIAVDDIGNIFIGGEFQKIQGVTHPFFSVLNADGTLSEILHKEGGNDHVLAVALQKNKPIIVGRFTNFNNIHRNRICRLTDDITSHFNKKDKAFINLFLLPNPNNGNFNIETNLEGHKNICIRNLSGAKIYEVTTDNLKFPILNLKLSQGLYFVEVQTEKERLVRKIVVAP